MAKYRGSLRAWWVIPLLLICLSVQAGSKLIDNESFSIQSNYLGTPEVMYNADGKVVWSAELDAYGDVRELTGDRTDCPFRYQGQYEDRETGLYYNRFRYYSAEEGIYISQDPIGLNGGAKLYGYVHDTNCYIDLLGLSPLIPDAPEYSGIYHIEGSDGRSYVGSAENIKERLDSSSHPTTADIINSGDYKVTFYEVNLGTASTRKEKDHILRHHEQQIMDQNGYVPGKNGNRNKNRPEALKKNKRNKGEVQQHGAGFTGVSNVVTKKQGNSSCE